MKKKTIITTETHEFWVIRQPGEVFAEEISGQQQSEAGGEPHPALPEYAPDQDEPEAQKNH